MPQENESIFIAESQSLNVDEQQKKDILYQFPLQGKQMDKDGRKAIMK